MKYIEALAPMDYTTDACEPFVFMCGGITDCPDWQQDFVKLMEKTSKGTLLNPRRANFPIGDPNAAKEQITWEYDFLSHSHMFIFWFSHATIQPIVLFELGTRLGKRHLRPEFGKLQPILIGIEEGYPREQDVRIQTELADPSIPIVRTLEELSGLLHEEVAKF